MAARKDKNLQPDDGAVIPRLSLKESGITGLLTSNGVILQEANRQFRYPNYVKVVEEMRNDATVASCLLAYKTMLGRVTWRVEAPVGATNKQIDRAAFIESCMHDMEGTWMRFITEVSSYLEYGFAVHEKVFRRRLRSQGSKYNDGLVGWRKLAPRSQTTISKWRFKDYGREIDYLEQDLANLDDLDKYNLAENGTKVKLPRSKLLLFTCDATLENPEGRSVLKGAYTSYRKLQLLQDQLMIGVARDLGGVPVVWCHPKYLDPNASDSDKAVYTAFQNVVNGITTGSQGGAVMPLMYDPDSKQPLFKMELLESKGGKAYDVPAIVEQFQKDIAMALSCSQLQMVGNTADNFSVNAGSTNLLALHLAYRCQEIADVINNDLIPETFRRNGWTDEEYPKVVFSDFDEIALEEFSKAIQRMASTGMLERDREVFNLIRTRLGLEAKPEDAPIEDTTPDTSRSGDGYAKGSGEGTRDTPSGRDTSSDNLDNAA